jgi:hypothetical protein
MSKPKDITLDEVLAEMDKLRRPKYTDYPPTEDQIKFLKAAREGQNVVSYPKLVPLWEKMGWGKIAPDTLRKLYVRFVVGGAT